MNATIDAGQCTGGGPAKGLVGWAERGWIPDVLLRHGIRRLCAQRLREEYADDPAGASFRAAAVMAALRDSPIAIHVDAANRQHYELPPAFFALCLGPRLKYSACLYPTGAESLAQAEEAMLALYAERAQLRDGQDILELGCGWGSLTLWMAERFPDARITAVSNAPAQRAFIEARCRERGIDNVRVMTCDVSRLMLEAEAFDRCVSVEMFEHIRNHEALMDRIAGWLRPGGKLFVHIFCHRTLVYPFETEGEDDWMGRHFFTGGLMPAADTLLWFQGALRSEARWLVDGTHYRRTADHWLANQDANERQVMAILREAYGAAAPLWCQRWRMFWMACAELFGYDGGRAWMVAHHRFVKEVP